MSGSAYYPSILGLPVELFVGLTYDVSEAVNSLGSKAGSGLSYSLPIFPCNFYEFPAHSVIESAIDLIRHYESQELERLQMNQNTSAQLPQESVRKRAIQFSELNSDMDDFNQGSSLVYKKSKISIHNNSKNDLTFPENAKSNEASNKVNGLCSSDVSTVFKDEEGTIEFLACLVDHVSRQSAPSQALEAQKSQVIEQSSQPASDSSNASVSTLGQSKGNVSFHGYQIAPLATENVHISAVNKCSRNLGMESEILAAVRGQQTQSTSAPMKLMSIDELVRQSQKFN